jgi:FixJ family two-component response regulator
MACIGLTALTTIEEKKAEKVVEKINSEIEQKDERTKIVNRIIAGRSNLSIAEELGIDRRKIARIKTELGQWQNKQRPINAQPNEQVVNLRVVKKESA